MHEAVGVEFHTIAVFIFEEEVIIELFYGVIFKKPLLIMTLPGDVEDSAWE